jgi:hypothetical protein
LKISLKIGGSCFDDNLKTNQGKKFEELICSFAKTAAENRSQDENRTQREKRRGGGGRPK